jgi:ESCRT-II complex subunit VPS36
MLLSDVYCVYNRARGTDPISPEDLLDAVKMQQKLALGMHLQEYPSGVRVLQIDSFDEAEARRRVQSMLLSEAEARHGNIVPPSSAALADDAHVSALDLATRWRIPMPVAQQILLAAEAKGLLCRDDSLSGLRFYLNRFLRMGG